MGFHVRGELLCDFAVVEVAGIGGDALEGGGELGLAEGVAGLVVAAGWRGLEDSVRLGKLRKVGIAQPGGLLIGKNEAVLGELDGGGHHCLETEFAVVLFGIGEACDRAGHSDGFVTEGACVGDDVALRVEVHVARSGARCFLAIVDEEIAFGALRKMHEHEAAAADISGDRVHDGEREAGGDRRIDRIAALLQDGDAGVRGVVMHADHHGVIGGGGGLVLRNGLRCGETHEEREGENSAGTGRHGRSVFESGHGTADLSTPPVSLARYRSGRDDKC